jgi:hypothetical protein
VNTALGPFSWRHENGLVADTELRSISWRHEIDLGGISMTEKLTGSRIDRQNILNNPYALEAIAKAARIQGIAFEGKSVVTKQQIAAFFEVTPRTIDNYIEKYGEELRENGYELLRGNRLRALKLELLAQGANETDFVTKTTVLGIFDFRAFLSLGMPQPPGFGLDIDEDMAENKSGEAVRAVGGLLKNASTPRRTRRKASGGVLF